MFINKVSVEEAEFLVLIINGGIGRNIMATAIVRNLKKAYPDKKLVVVCGCPEIFLQNPHIYRVYSLSNSVYFYEDFIQHKKSAIVSVEPYQHFDYVYKKKHFVECWCDMIGIPCDNIYPEIFLCDIEKTLAQWHLKTFDRPMVLCQFEGGKVPEGKDNKSRISARNAMYQRSIPEELQVKIVDQINTFGFKTGVVAHENQYVAGCCERISYPIRAIIALLPYVAGVICIDSFLMHGCAMFKKKAVTIWGGTSPDVLGYDYQTNLRKQACVTPECHRPNSFLFDIEPNGYQWLCPSNMDCLKYSLDEVIEAWDKTYDGLGGKAQITTAEQPPVLPSGINPYDKTNCPCDKDKKPQESLAI